MFPFVPDKLLMEVDAGGCSALLALTVFMSAPAEVPTTGLVRLLALLTVFTSVPEELLVRRDTKGFAALLVPEELPMTLDVECRLARLAPTSYV